MQIIYVLSRPIHLQVKLLSKCLTQPNDISIFIHSYTSRIIFSSLISFALSGNLFSSTFLLYLLILILFIIIMSCQPMQHASTIQDDLFRVQNQFILMLQTTIEQKDSLICQLTTSVSEEIHLNIPKECSQNNELNKSDELITYLQTELESTRKNNSLEIRAVQQQNDKLQEEKYELIKKLCELKQEVQISRVEKIASQQLMAIKEANQRQVQSMQQKSYQEELRRLEQTKNTELAELKDSFSRMKASKYQWMAKINVLNQENCDWDHVQDDQQAISKIQNLLSGEDQNQKAHQDKYNSLLTNHQLQRRQFEEQIKQLRSSLVEKEAELKQLSEDIEASQKESMKQVNEIEAKTRFFHQKIKAFVVNKQSSLKEPLLNQDIDQNKALAEIQKMISNLIALFEELQNSRRVDRQAITTHIKSISALNDSALKNRQQVEHLKQQIKKNIQELQIQQKNILKLNQEVEKLKALVSKKNSLMNQQQELIKQKEAKILEQKQEMNELKLNTKEIEKRLQSENDDQRTKLMNLKSDLQLQKNSNQKQLQSFSNLEKQHQETRKLLEGEKAMTQQLSKQIDFLQNSLKQLTSEKSELTIKNQKCMQRELAQEEQNRSSFKQLETLGSRILGNFKSFNPKESYPKLFANFASHLEIFISGLKYFSDSEILCDETLEKTHFLIQAFQKYSHAQTFKTQLLYRYDKLNQQNFHSYFDRKANLMLLVKLNNKKIIGGFSQKAYNPQITNYQPCRGFIFELESEEIFLPKENPRNAVISYDPYFIIFGNAEIRIKSLETTVFTNFGIAHATFEKRNKNRIDFFGIDASETQFLTYEVYQLHSK